METAVIIAGLALVLVSVLLSTGFDRLMRRFGAGPADPDERSGGIVDVVWRLRQWSSKRGRDRNDRRSRVD